MLNRRRAVTRCPHLLHSSTPTAGAELLKLGGEKDGSEASAGFLELGTKVKVKSSLNMASMEDLTRSKLRANVNGDSGAEAGDVAGDGSQVLVHHYLAAANYRASLATFFSNIFGLDRDKLLAKMNRLGNDAATKLIAKVAAGKPCTPLLF